MLLADELWRRAQSRRETAMAANLSDADRMILPLVLSLARLAAQRDARACTAPVRTDPMTTNEAGQREIAFGGRARVAPPEGLVLQP